MGKRDSGTVPCPMGQSCPSTVTKRHRAGSKELEEHGRLARRGSKLQKTVTPAKVASGFSDKEAPPVPAMTVAELSDFIVSSDISVDADDGMGVTVSRGDIGLSVSMSKADAEAIAGSEMGSQDFDSDLLVGMNGMRSVSREEINANAALAATYSKDVAHYRPAVRDFLDTHATYTSLNRAAVSSGQGRGYFQRVVDKFRGADDVSRIRYREELCESVGREIAGDLSIEPAGSESKDGGRFSFSYPDKTTGTRREFEITVDGMYGMQNPYSALARSAVDVVQSEPDGIESVVMQRNFVSDVDARGFRFAADSAVEARDIMLYRKGISEQLLGEVG